jgi:XTP/dITP diphosphohydrolase
MKTLYFITGNTGKVTEATEKLKPFQIQIVQKDLGYPEIQADSLLEVAQFGVNHVKPRFKKPFILEDAGLFIDAFHGFPGVYSKYVFYTIGLPGILRLLDEQKNRSALFRSVFALFIPTKDPLFFTGETKGNITLLQKGSGGFGYDPLFIPEGSTKTFAEMDIVEKNKCSHRGKALTQIVEFFKQHDDVFDFL